MDTREFDERNEKKSRSVCERIEREDEGRRVELSERERQILDMWPRFEDGEPVWFGDEVDDFGVEVTEVYLAENEVAVWNSRGGHMNLALGERVKRPVHRVMDADGVEIRVGDTVYERNGNHHIVKEVYFDDDDESPEHTVWCGEYKMGCKFVYTACSLTHTSHDSWGLLELDADSGPLRYCTARGIYYERGSTRSMVEAFASDIIRRAKALAEVEVGE